MKNSESVLRILRLGNFLIVKLLHVISLQFEIISM